MDRRSGWRLRQQRLGWSARRLLGAAESAGHWLAARLGVEPRALLAAFARQAPPRLVARISTWAAAGGVACALIALLVLIGAKLWARDVAWLGQLGLVQLSGAVVFAGAWLFTRHGSASEGAAKLIDVALAAWSTLIVLGSAWHLPLSVRPDFIAVLAIGQLLTARAVLIPSTRRRTLVVNVGCALPIVAFSGAYFGSRLPPGADPGPLGYAWLAAGLAASVVVLATLVARAAQRWQSKQPRETGEMRQLGQYSLVERIGGGGMGVVYKAEHATLRRPTAIKILPPEKAGEAGLRRFEREARMTARLCHPNTVSVYDYGRTPGGTFYYAMEYIEGIDLEMLVRHDGPQPPGRVIQILLQVCGSLAEAHAIGLIHQDIKPGNVFLCERAGMVDVVKVLDFGLVQRFGEVPTRDTTAAPESGERSRQQFVGTPHYIAPEAILGKGEVDGRTDIYALGCLAHYLLTGNPPFSGNTVLEVLGQHLHATPRSFASQSKWPISAELEQVVLSCLGKARVQRPTDASTLYAMLRSCPEAEAWDQDQGRRWWVERGAALQAAITAARVRHTAPDATLATALLQVSGPLEDAGAVAAQR